MDDYDLDKVSANHKKANKRFIDRAHPLLQLHPVVSGGYFV